MGIPVTQIEQVSDQKLHFTIAEKDVKSRSLKDLLVYADSFHMAKYLIKHEAYANNFEVGFLPMDADGGSNFAKLKLCKKLFEGREVNEADIID
jgi:hypothetical protein